MMLVVPVVIKNFNVVCSVFLCKLAKPLNAILCCRWSFLVHRKCNKCKLSKIRDFYKSKVDRTWDCYSCEKERFPFVDLDNKTKRNI